MTDARLRIAFPPSPEREIGNIDEGPHDGTKRLRKRGHLEPLVQGTALVRLELTETDPPDRCGVNEPLPVFPVPISEGPGPAPCCGRGEWT